MTEIQTINSMRQCYSTRTVLLNNIHRYLSQRVAGLGLHPLHSQTPLPIMATPPPQTSIPSPVVLTPTLLRPPTTMLITAPARASFGSYSARYDGPAGPVRPTGAIGPVAPVRTLGVGGWKDGHCSSVAMDPLLIAIRLWQ